MKRISIAIALSLAAVSAAAAGAPRRASFLDIRTNIIPLKFGMSAAEAAAALGEPLVYISGKRGNEMLATVRPSPIYINREARLFLQFRNDRLTGWKGDWGRNWMWY